MLKKFIIKLKLKNEVVALITLIILTSIFTVYHNQTKNNNNQNKLDKYTSTTFETHYFKLRLKNENFIDSVSAAIFLLRYQISNKNKYLI